jgi:hypothetical protein
MPLPPPRLTPSKKPRTSTCRRPPAGRTGLGRGTPLASRVHQPGQVHTCCPDTIEGPGMTGHMGLRRGNWANTGARVDDRMAHPGRGQEELHPFGVMPRAPGGDHTVDRSSHSHVVHPCLADCSRSRSARSCTSTSVREAFSSPDPTHARRRPRRELTGSGPALSAGRDAQLRCTAHPARRRSRTAHHRGL